MDFVYTILFQNICIDIWKFFNQSNELRIYKNTFYVM
jgi:hypothetical protein